MDNSCAEHERSDQSKAGDDVIRLSSEGSNTCLSPPPNGDRLELDCRPDPPNRIFPGKGWAARGGELSPHGMPENEERHMSQYIASLHDWSDLNTLVSLHISQCQFLLLRQLPVPVSSMAVQRYRLNQSQDVVVNHKNVAM